MLRIPFWLLIVTVAQAATPAFHPSFDNPAESWAVVRGSASLDPVILRDGKKSPRLERDAASEDACVRLTPVALTIGKRYELSGWVRAESIEVRDLDRTPIAVGAALAMESMPFDVHSASLGGTHPWTRLALQFVATRAQDHILLMV